MTKSDHKFMGNKYSPEETTTLCFHPPGRKYDEVEVGLGIADGLQMVLKTM